MRGLTTTALCLLSVNALQLALSPSHGFLKRLLPRGVVGKHVRNDPLSPRLLRLAIGWAWPSKHVRCFNVVFQHTGLRISPPIKLIARLVRWRIVRQCGVKVLLSALGIHQ